jgi:hypothetical protein
METQTHYVEILIPDGREVYRITHHCANLQAVLMAIAYLLVTTNEYYDFCYNPDKQIDMDTNYIFPEQLLHMLASLPEAMRVLAHPRGIVSIQKVEMDLVYGENDSLWSVDKDYDARKGLDLQKELALIQQINAEATQCE